MCNLQSSGTFDSVAIAKLLGANMTKTGNKQNMLCMLDYGNISSHQSNICAQIFNSLFVSLHLFQI